MTIPFSKVDCAGNEMKYIEEVLKSGWLTTASKCAEFERKFIETVGCKYACAVSSATAALHLALDAIGIGPSDKVFVPTLTFTASAEVVRYCGADPIFLDVDYATCLVTPDILEEGIKKHPGAKAIILVHFGGQAADMANIVPLCNRYGIRVVEDASHAFPTSCSGRMIGSWGDVTCFSFYANKTITTGEGGMLVTNDEKIYNRAKIMRLHGINRDIWDRFTAEISNWEYDVIAPGFKYNLSDIAAAIGLAQLERTEDFRQNRQRCAEHYFNYLNDVECLDLPHYRESMENQSWHLFWIILNEKTRIDRNQFIEELNASGIGTSVHYKPLHRMTYYQNRYSLQASDFPNAERIWKGTVSLPIYPSLTHSDLEIITNKVLDILQ